LVVIAGSRLRVLDGAYFARRAGMRGGDKVAMRRAIMAKSGSRTDP
jgi:hypothetical protein